MGSLPRHGFTWVELLIALVVLGIAAAVAGPYLLERHKEACQMGAVRTVKSGFLPALTAFQAAAYSDIDGDGRGEYAMDHRYLAGAVGTLPGSGIARAPLNLLPAKFNLPEGGVIDGYRFQVDTDVGTAATSIANAESYFGVYAVPATRFDGDWAWAMSVSGVVFAGKQSYRRHVTELPLVTGGVAPDNTGLFTNTDALLLSDPRSGYTICSANAAPFGI